MHEPLFYFSVEAALVLGHDHGIADRPGEGRTHGHGAQANYAHAAVQLAELSS